MDKRIKLLLTTTTTTLLTLNIIIAIVYGATANAYPIHPDVKVYGVINKPVYVGHEWQKYVADDGLTYTLPFERQDKTITISFENIVFVKNFENKSIASATETKTSVMTVTKDVLSASGQEYVYLKQTNSSSLTTSTWYNLIETLYVSDEPEVNNNYYLLVTAKPKKSSNNIDSCGACVRFYFKDSGATERMLEIVIYQKSGVDAYTSGTDYVAFNHYMGGSSEYYTVQLKIQDMLDAEGKSWSLVKLTKIAYVIYARTGETLDSENTWEAWFKHAIVSPSKIYIDDGSETGLVVNGTSGNFPYSAGDVIQIYGANATKITSVSIPFQMEDTRPIEERVTTIPQSYGFQYEWRFVMPKSPTETGDKFTYSDTNITLRCWYDGVFIKNLWVNGVDKTSAVSSKKTPTTEGLTDQERYWTYGLASSLVGGNQYDIEMRVEDLPSDVWYSLTEEPQKILTWSWFYDRILAIIQAILNFLGFSVTSIELKRRELRVPKAS